MKRAHDIAELAYVAHQALAVVAAKGLESSDVPRLWLDATLRWAEGTDPDHAIGPYTAALHTLLLELADYPAEDGKATIPPHVTAMLYMANVCGELRLARRAWRAGRMMKFDRLFFFCALILTRFLGETEAAAKERVWRWYREAENGATVN